MNAIQIATPNTSGTETNAQVRARRAASIANAKTKIDATIIGSVGIATRRSAIDDPTTRAPPSQCTVPAMPSSASPETHTAGLASHGETYPKLTAVAAAGLTTLGP